MPSPSIEGSETAYESGRREGSSATAIGATALRRSADEKILRASLFGYESLKAPATEVRRQAATTVDLAYAADTATSAGT